MADLLAGGLSGGGCSRTPETPPRPRSNMLSIAIDPAAFTDPPPIAVEIKRYVDFVRSARPRDPETPVMLPGEPERKTRAERLAGGINIDPETWTQIIEAGVLARPRWRHARRDDRLERHPWVLKHCYKTR